MGYACCDFLSGKRSLVRNDLFGEPRLEIAQYSTQTPLYVIQCLLVEYNLDNFMTYTQCVTTVIGLKT